MFNSMVGYLWGESAEAGDNAEVKMEDVQLDTHQDDDWVVVDQGSPAAHTERRPSLELREEGVRSSTVNRRRREAQENHLGLNTKNQLTPAQVTKKMHLARRSQRKQNNKALSAHKLQRESRVLDKSFVKSNSCKNKNDRPSGMKAGRMAQRV